MLLDTHYHFDFLPDDAEFREAFAFSLDQKGIGLIAQNVLPSHYEQLANQVNHLAVIHPSLGFHPWWIKSYDQVDHELAIFRKALKEANFIGEVGLDFAPKVIEQATEDLQEYAFDIVLKGLVEQAGPRRVVSIHAVRSVDQVLDHLDRHQVVEYNIIPILHRFNGTSDQLTRHIRSGGYLSVHPDMLDTKKGRAYVQQVPADRLLLETDLPKSVDDISDPFADLVTSLQTTLETITDLRNQPMREIIIRNQKQVYIEEG